MVQGLTAWHLLRTSTHLQPGESVVVHAAAGGVGTLAIKAANDGRGVDIVLEMVGGPTFDASLAALAPFGRLATFGMASRTPPKPVNAGELMARSRAVVGFWL